MNQAGSVLKTMWQDRLIEIEFMKEGVNAWHWE